MALVTGASAGIGAAICKMLASNGINVVGCARREDRVKELAKEFPLIRAYRVSVLCYHEIKKKEYQHIKLAF